MTLSASYKRARTLELRSVRMIFGITPKLRMKAIFREQAAIKGIMVYCEDFLIV